MVARRGTASGTSAPVWGWSGGAEELVRGRRPRRQPARPTRRGPPCGAPSASAPETTGGLTSGKLCWRREEVFQLFPWLIYSLSMYIIVHLFIS